MIYNLARNVATTGWQGPTATAFAGNVVGFDGSSPRPTQDPLNYEVFKRQVGDRTCGYRDGERRTPLTCRESSLCVTNTFFGFIGCCDPDGIESCTPPTACIPSTRMEKCNSRCQEETKTVKCPNAESPNCMTAYHDFVTTQFTEYRCGGNVRFTAFPTFSGQSTATRARTSQSSSIIIVPGDDDSDSLEEEGGGGGGGGAEMASTNGVEEGEDEPEIDDGNKDEPEINNDNKGAIVGGVVGGLSVLAFLILGLIALLLRHRRLKSLQMLEDPAAGQRGLKSDVSGSSRHNQVAMHWHGRRIYKGFDRSRGGSESSHKAILKDSQEISEAP